MRIGLRVFMDVNAASVIEQVPVPLGYSLELLQEV
jgi:hypothetical protein